MKACPLFRRGLILTVTIVGMSFASVRAGQNFVSAIGAGGVVVTDASGGALDFGDVWRIGAFDISGGNAGIIATSTNFLEIDALFTPLGEISDPWGTAGRNGLTAANSGTVGNQPAQPNINGPMIVNDNGGVDGEIFGAVADWTAGYMPEDTKLYWWVFSSSDPVTASQMGIFSSDATQWGSADPGNNIDFRTTAAATVNEVLRGTTDTGNLVSFSELRLEAIPEPSRSLLLLFGVMGAVFVRRRRA